MHGEVLRQLKRPSLLIPVLVVLALVLVALAAPLISPYDPLKQHLAERLLPPSWVDPRSHYLLGTDSLGRDVLSRLIYGSRITLSVAVAALLSAGAIGLTLGIVSGFVGRTVDAVIMRAVDITLSFPTLLIALLLAVTLGASIKTVIIAVAAILWAQFTRIIRGEVLALRETDFVAQAKINGCSTPYIMFRYIMPNVLNTFMVLLSLNIGSVIIIESTLSFLGAGVPPPDPTWGQMTAEGRQYIRTAWWLTIVPGTAIMAVVMSFSLLGDWLRDFLDPKLRQV